MPILLSSPLLGRSSSRSVAAQATNSQGKRKQPPRDSKQRPAFEPRELTADDAPPAGRSRPDRGRVTGPPILPPPAMVVVQSGIGSHDYDKAQVFDGRAMLESARAAGSRREARLDERDERRERAPAKAALKPDTKSRPIIDPPSPSHPSDRLPLNSLLSDISTRALTLDAAGIRAREGTLVRLNGFLAHAFPHDRLFAEPFGSYAMGVSSPNGDMDIKLDGTVDLSFHPRSVYRSSPGGGASGPEAPRGGGQVDLSRLPRGWATDVLHDFHRAVKRGRLAEMGREAFPRAILHARVPITTYRDALTGIDCDISINSDGVLKSQALGAVLALDPRAASLVRLAKQWARQYEINDASMGTLRSWAVTLMCVTHLQVQEPPVLPPLRVVFDERGPGGGGRPLIKGAAPSSAQVQHLMQGVTSRAAAWADARSRGDAPRNTASLDELVTSFFLCLHNGVARHSEARAAAGALIGFDPWEGRLLEGQRTLVVVDPFVLDNCGSNLSPTGTPQTWEQLADACERAATALAAVGSSSSDGGRMAAAEACVRVLGRSCVDKALDGHLPSSSSQSRPARADAKADSSFKARGWADLYSTTPSDNSEGPGRPDRPGRGQERSQAAPGRWVRAARESDSNPSDLQGFRRTGRDAGAARPGRGDPKFKGDQGARLGARADPDLPDAPRATPKRRQQRRPRP